MLKQDGSYFDKMEQAVKHYNNSYHSAIDSKPIDVFYNRVNNDKYDERLLKYQKRFNKIGQEDKFKIYDHVYFLDNRVERKKTEPKFIGRGIIKECKKIMSVKLISKINSTQCILV